MRKIVLVALFILGSQWFVPVSCTTGTFVGMRLISDKTARDMTRGEKPHPRFYVIAELPDRKTVPVPFSDLDRFKGKNVEPQFLLTKSNGVIEEGTDRWEYSKKEESARKQKIVVSYKGDNQSSESIYLVNEDTITPIYSKILSPGHMFTALPFALALSFFILLFSRAFYGKIRDGRFSVW